MGLFSSKYVTTVGTVVNRVIQDTDIPNAVGTGVTKALFGKEGGDIPAFIMEELVTSIAVRAERMYAYGKNHYTHGVPSGQLFTATQGKAQVEFLLGTLEGEPIALDYYQYGPQNSLHYGWVTLVDSHGYNTGTNQLGVLSAEKGVPVYLDNMVVVFPDGTLEQVNLPAVYQWGVAAKAGYTPEKTVATPELGHMVIPSPLHIVAEGAVEYLRIEYVWEAGGVLSRGSFDIPLPSYGVQYVLSTKLLLHADEPPGSYITLDSSEYLHQVVNAGSVELSPEHAKYNNALAFNGGDGSYLEVPYSHEFDLLEHEFDIHTQVYVPALLGTRQFLMGWWGPTEATTDHSWALLVGTDGTLQFDYSSLLDVADYTLSSVATIPTGVVTEVGVARSGNVLSIKVGTTVLTFPFDKTIRTIAGDIEPPLYPSVSLVSLLYPVETLELLDISHALVSGGLREAVVDNLDVSHSLISGAISQVLQTYSNGPIENMDVSHALNSGALAQVLKTYSDAPVELLDVTHTLSSGTLSQVLIGYNFYAIETMDVSHTLISGVLS